ncbi:glycosyltransferase family 2 protein [Rhizobium sp. YTU87027]|uniref:glycosyltransferase family 2 protein n=1 Tax=Rhizobium sp. YTU87027 TaxID=3417741 RepID=UPI003D68302F
MNKQISIVVPVYNEQAVVEIFYEKFTRVLSRLPDYNFEILFVNDGSSDQTQQIVDNLASRDARVSSILFSRNFGKEAAMTAGLDAAQGDAVAIFDVDLQDPPELLVSFVEQWEAGYDVVNAMRIRREGETWLKRFTAAGFYRIMKRMSPVTIPADTGDCRLLSQRAVHAIRQLRENHRFMKGLYAWIGYPTTAVEYERSPRAAGKTSFNYWKLWNFAIEGFTSFSTIPLRIALYFGTTISACAFMMGTWIILKTLIWGEAVHGYPTIIVSILFLGGIQLFFIGVLGEYIGRIYGETKKRPLYLIQHYKPSQIGRSRPGDA